MFTVIYTNKGVLHREIYEFDIKSCATAKARQLRTIPEYTSVKVVTVAQATALNALGRTRKAT